MTELETSATEERLDIDAEKTRSRMTVLTAGPNGRRRCASWARRSA